MNNDLKLSENTIVRINNNIAEIIVDNTYKLTIVVEKERVIAKYSGVSLTIEYNKFNAEKLARKIYVIVQQSHRFSVSIIQRTLQLLTIDKFISEVIGTKREENTELLKKIIDFLSKS